MSTPSVANDLALKRTGHRGDLQRRRTHELRVPEVALRHCAAEEKSHIASTRFDRLFSVRLRAKDEHPLASVGRVVLGVDGIECPPHVSTHVQLSVSNGDEDVCYASRSVRA